MPGKPRHITLTETEIRQELARLEALRHVEEMARVAERLDVIVPKDDAAAAAEKLMLDECGVIKEFSSSRLESAVSRFNTYSSGASVFHKDVFSSYFSDKYIRVSKYLVPPGADVGYRHNHLFEALGHVRYLRHLIKRQITDIAFEHGEIDEIIHNHNHQVKINKGLGNALLSNLSCTFGFHRYNLLGIGIESAYGVCQRCLRTKEFKPGKRTIGDGKTQKWLKLVFQTQDPMLLDYFKWATNKGYRDRFIKDSMTAYAYSTINSDGLEYEDFYQYKAWEGPCLEQYLRVVSNAVIRAICEKQLPPEIPAQQ